jgi:flagellar hook-associated protein 2
MASITASGVGSGLDIASLVTQLMNAERAGPEARLNREQSTAQAQISALGSLRSALSLLGGSLQALQSATVFEPRRTSSSASTVVTATATAAAATGSYQVEVTSLASSQRLGSGPYASATTAIGTGTLNFSVGSESFNVLIDGSNNSVAGIRDAINAAIGNDSVSASVINTTEGTRLVLASNSSGAANAITVTRTGGDGGLDALVYNPGVLTNLEVKSPAADAQVVIDGFNFSSATNTLSGAVSGVTFELLSKAPGEAKTVSIARDTDTARKSLEAFISAYNSTLGSLSAATRYDPQTKTASSLTGDPLPRSVGAELRRIIGTAGSGSDGVRTLADLGIKTSVSGTLTLDAAKFSAALAAHPEQVAALVTGSNGIAAKLDAVVKRMAGSDGAIASRTEGLDSRLRGIDDRRSALNTRLASIEARYRAQFTALDGLVAKLQSTSSFLTAQLG